ncbi:fluoride efflux transporter FluC [Streptomyces yaizuensis]|uniref:Fluoride-specific ion channel FluC n=1 Tax=Streptomyces yaizuensis TaxID=2989713 RepID=A0ABQ5P1Q0_9ACTN|nr:CrcB family protein [Streptomyces sp. YSPA8]GLF96524.1 CrcB family protein [Streptomyces sp. YSPA8]
MTARGPGAGPGPDGPDDLYAAVDPEVDLRVPAQRAETAGARLPLLLAVIAAGGVAGALARYGLFLAWPWSGRGFPWTTFVINACGSALMGVLMQLIAADGRAAHPLVRPFAGVGVLGGFTTFSAYAGDIHVLLERREHAVALLYAAGTVLCCVTAVWLAAAATRAVLARGPGARGGRGGHGG